MNNKYITWILWLLHLVCILFFIWIVSFLSLFLPIEKAWSVYVDLLAIKIDIYTYNYVFLSLFSLFQWFMIWKNWNFLKKIGFSAIIIALYFLIPAIF